MKQIRNATKAKLKALEGIQTIETIMDGLGVGREKAIYHIHRLKKSGYVKTRRMGNKRIYYISFENKLGGQSYYEIINKNSPIKIMEPELHKVYGRNIGLEETMIFALKTKSPRTILAAISLFKKIRNWKKLYNLAKTNHLEQQIGALYDVARATIKVRRMPVRFRHNALPVNKGFEFMIENMKSRDYKEIEELWKIYLPFNRNDLEELK